MLKRYFAVLLLAIVVSSLTSFSTLACVGDNNWEPRVTGTARSIDTGDIVYTEHYFTDSEMAQTQVIYRSPTRSVFATKALYVSDASAEPMAPEFVFWDYRSSKAKIRVTRDDKTYWGSAPVEGVEPHSAADKDFDKALFCAQKEWPGAAQAKYNASSGEPELEKPPLVIDAGFDFFIRRYWNDMIDGSRKRFRFAAPTSSGYIEMIARSDSNDSCNRRIDAILAEDADSESRSDNAERNNYTGGHSCFVLQPSNWLVKQIVKPIYLLYGENDKRLYYFYGLTDIKGERDENQRMLIGYNYFDRE